MAQQSTQPAASSTPNYLIPFTIVAALFGIFGFLTSLNNQLVDKLKATFQLSYGQAMLATSAWFLAYLIFSVPSSKLIEWVGYKKTMVISLFIMVLGALAFIPAASVPSFPLTLCAIFLLATGVCALQTSANPYAAILGPEESAALRVNLAQAFNSAASAIAPIVATTFILTGASNSGTQAEQAHMLITPYIVIGVALLVLGFIVMGLHLPAIAAPASGTSAPSQRSIWSYRHVVLGMIGIFFYVGVEQATAAIGRDFFRSQGLSNAQTAGYLITTFWLLAMIGRFIGSAVMTKIKPQKLLAAMGIAGVVLVLLGMLTSGVVAISSLVLLGLANAIMYPTIFALGIAELGPLTSKGSGVITIGNVGGAAIPPLLGLLTDITNLRSAMVLFVICYIFITYYGLSGYKPTRAAA